MESREGTAQEAVVHQVDNMESAQVSLVVNGNAQNSPWRLLVSLRFPACQWESRKRPIGHTDRDDLLCTINPDPKEYTTEWETIYFLSNIAWTIFPTPPDQSTWAARMWHSRAVITWPASRSKLSTQTLANTWGTDLLTSKCKRASLGFMSVVRWGTHFS